MFRIDNYSRQPIYEQLIEQFEKLVLTGAMPPGTQLPSVRSLSLSLSVNPNTIQKAYSELDLRGLIYSLPGKGSYVANDAAARIGNDRVALLDDLRATLTKLKDAGIPKDEIDSAVTQIYCLTEENHDKNK